MKNCICSILFLIFAGCALQVRGQDPRFLQYYNDPLYTNPSLTGTFDGRYRFIGHYRHQWASVSRAFQTGGATVDAANIFNIKKLGAGIAIFNDVAGDGDFQRLSAMFSLSYSIPLTADSAHNIILGAQGGINNYSLNVGQLFFDDQYQNGYFDPSRPTAETFGADQSTSPLINSGITYRFTPKDRVEILAGAALHNTLQPYYGITPNEEFEDRRLSLHATGKFPVHSAIDLEPGVRYMSQGPHREMLTGINATLHLDPKPYRHRSISAGPWWRAGDAVALYTGFEYDEWRVGLSYGFNTSSLQVASNNRGGWEISIRYIIRHIMPKKSKFKKCPEFL